MLSFDWQKKLENLDKPDSCFSLFSYLDMYIEILIWKEQVLIFYFINK